MKVQLFLKVLGLNYSTIKLIVLESLIVKKLLKNILTKLNLKLVNNKLYNDELKKSISASDLEFLKTCKNENLKKLFDYFKDSKSQLRQDLFVINELNFKKKGFFCEFGACDGIELSNLYLIEKKIKWEGIKSETAKFYKKKIKKAKISDWSKEYLSSIVSVKVVKNIDDAINHINKYGTMHTDAIITQNLKSAKKFLNGVKSSIAMHNTSTQFADGEEFGFGGEIGISTNTLPPRGPVGLNQLVSYKYKVSSKGKVRD